MLKSFIKRKIPDKCRKCAMLTAAVAKSIHGADGDNCWNPSVCYNRRSYARNHNRHNSKRALKRSSSVTKEQISSDVEDLKNIIYAVLVVYRYVGAEAPVHAISAEVWKGKEKIANVETIHCFGMVRSQILAYLRKVLDVLSANYDIQKFASLRQLHPDLCPIRPCPHCYSLFVPH